MKKEIAIAAIALGVILGVSIAIGVQPATGEIANSADPNLVLEVARRAEQPKPASSIYPSVRLCESKPGFSGPFPDVGYCIDGFIFAAIGSKPEQLTWLRPARYSKNAVGSSCSFTVRANCEVVK